MTGSEHFPRILSLHAYYKERGGEDVSHDSEVRYLRHKGFTVHDFTIRNMEFSPGALRNTARSLEDSIARFKPDLVYMNNLHPILQYPAMRLVRDLKLPYVRVLRNYRFGCLAGTIFRDGHLCTECIQKESHIPGVIYGCFRSSRTKSLVAGLSIDQQQRRGHWEDAGVYIAVSEYVRNVAVRTGIHEGRILVRPNLVLTEPGMAPGIDAEAASPFLYVGRNDPNKGLQTLLEAYASTVTARGLDVVGVEDTLSNSSQNGVSYAGQLQPSDVLRAMRRARCLIVPSVWPEPFGRVVTEALSQGTPVIVAKSGGLTSMVGPGVYGVEPGSAPALADALASMDGLTPSAYAEASHAALARFSNEFSPDRWFALTNQAFEMAISSHPRPQSMTREQRRNSNSDW